jgi:carbon storage regulator
MLILKRKMGEGIDVGNNIRIVLKEISGGHVKIGIEAPTDISVRRSETAVSIEEENVRAAKSCITGAKSLHYLAGIANVGRGCTGACSCAQPCGGQGSHDKVGKEPSAGSGVVKR